ncbi:hypothetical protein ACJMK2_012148 [Sinanodonta woodiana]|uniref:Major facilitator superfamily (MFS) profile domain-containing protein n=1 Tax=Sinanodonta woodiana TaxID=1069815 RepID=A0ABD3V7A1_SINWO
MSSAVRCCPGSRESVPLFSSQRWILCYMLFLINFIGYAHRVSLSLAIVCMVRVPPSDNISMHGQIDNITLLPAKVFLESNYSLRQPPNVGESEISSCTESTSDAEKEYERAEFDWSKSLQSSLLASYFYGVILTQIPGAWLAGRYGGKRVITVYMVTTAACSLLLPVATRTNVYLTFALRIITGLASGPVSPVSVSMANRWASPAERGRFLSVFMMGFTSGTIVTFLTSGYLCAYGFDNGWASIFYIYGILTVIFLLLWIYLVADSPDEHPRISAAEKLFLRRTAIHSNNITYPTPWRKLFTSRPVLACMVTHFVHNWSFFTILITLPLFMKEVLRFNIKENGALTSLPYVTMTVSMYATGHIADCLPRKLILSILATRRTLQISAFVGMGICLLVVGFVTCELRTLSVVILCICTIFAAFTFGGLCLSHMDFAGPFAGTAFAITNAVGHIPGMLAPQVAGFLTPKGSPEEWRNVFFVAVALLLIGALIFGMFSSATTQSWAKFELNDPKVIVELVEQNKVKGKSVNCENTG